MTWSDITRPPSSRTLRQFAAILVVFTVAILVWRLSHDTLRLPLGALLVAGMVAGSAGMIQPSWIRWLFTGWMVLAFPIGWVVSNVMLALLFYVVVTPIALVFRMTGRDALSLRHSQTAPGRETHWSPKGPASKPEDYLRQS